MSSDDCTQVYSILISKDLNKNLYEPGTIQYVVDTTLNEIDINSIPPGALILVTLDGQVPLATMAFVHAFVHSFIQQIVSAYYNGFVMCQLAWLKYIFQNFFSCMFLVTVDHQRDSHVIFGGWK